MPTGVYKRIKQSHCLRGHKRTKGNVDCNGGCIKCQKKRGKEFYQNNRDKAIAAAKKQHLAEHGWTSKSIVEARIKQHNCCDLCGKPFTEYQQPYADHEHVFPPLPRGLLHTRCNTMLGAIEDAEFREAAMKYLRKWGK